MPILYSFRNKLLYRHHLWLSRTCVGKPSITDSFLENVVLKALHCKALLNHNFDLST